MLVWLSGDHVQANLVSNVYTAILLLLQHSIKVKFCVKLRNYAVIGVKPMTSPIIPFKATTRASR